jgi:hypothetical protein
MTQESRRQVLIKAIHDAAIELATRAAAQYAAPQLDNKKPTPVEIRAVAAAIESAAGGARFDNTAADELWCAYAVNTVSGKRCAGLGRTAAEAKASAWINTHWPGGTTSALVNVLTEVPDGWNFELYPPTKPKPQMLAISTLCILDLVRLTVPDATSDEVANIIMQSLPYMGGRSAVPQLRSSSELPDDAGRVFITNVPDAPLQVLGRRDPATGELCVGSVVFPDRLPDVAPPRGVEVVTGPEAERLILAVHQMLTRKALEKGLTLEAYAEQMAAAERASCQPKTERDVERYGRIERAYQAALAGRDQEFVASLDVQRAIEEAVPDATMDEIKKALSWAESKDKWRQ